MAKHLLFSFADLSTKDRAAKLAAKFFAKAGAAVVAQDVSSTIKKTSGVAYREMTLTFADSQVVVLRIKETGDIFQALLNGKPFPIKNQDDHEEAFAELAGAMAKGRAAYQKKLAAAKVVTPAGVRSTAPKIEAVLTAKRDSLKEAIADVREKISALRDAPPEPVMDDALNAGDSANPELVGVAVQGEAA
ncbi:hypothetical protein [Uliginosibacterium sediminicola]|uniref:Defence against restriction A N-terminal domain-containing protein n=1 Tax=Uliginosibacterium sediminicola TaxID=2024550 RepID=A0ABU9YVW6_9RHOO